MSVLMTLYLEGDPAALERYADDDHERIRAISDSAKQHGLIAHRFYGSDDGHIMVVDEWPDPESCQAFFSEQQEHIGSLMGEAGVKGEPRPTFWRKLETHDEVGWEG